MNKENILWFCIIGFTFVSLLGTLSHFFYEWSGNNAIIGIFFPINESTWEHLKLIILPWVIFFSFGLIWFKGEKNYISACFLGLLVSLIIVPIIFYSYTALVGKSILIIDIATFYISVLSGFIVSYFLLKWKGQNKILHVISIVGMIIILVCYFTFTAFPPNMFLFDDPLLKIM